MDGIIITKKNREPMDNQDNKMTDLQHKFIWLAFAEKMKYSEIAKELNVSRKELPAWTKKFESDW